MLVRRLERIAATAGMNFKAEGSLAFLARCMRWITCDSLARFNSNEVGEKNKNLPSHPSSISPSLWWACLVTLWGWLLAFAFSFLYCLIVVLSLFPIVLFLFCLQFSYSGFQESFHCICPTCFGFQLNSLQSSLKGLDVKNALWATDDDSFHFCQLNENKTEMIMFGFSTAGNQL